MAPHPALDPVARRLRPRRQQRRRLSAAAARRRSAAAEHRAVLQPHRLSRLARPRLRRAGESTIASSGSRRSRRARALRRRAVGLSRQGRSRRSGAQRRRRRARRQSRRRLLLRSGDRRRRIAASMSKRASPISSAGAACRRRPWRPPTRSNSPFSPACRSTTSPAPSGRSPRCRRSARESSWRLRSALADTPADALDLIAAEGDRAWRLRAPLLPIVLNGAGDLIAALFFFHWLTTGSAAEALAPAASSVHGVLAATAAAGARELRLIAAQDELVRPTKRLRAEAI